MPGQQLGGEKVSGSLLGADLSPNNSSTALVGDAGVPEIAEESWAESGADPLEEVIISASRKHPEQEPTVSYVLIGTPAWESRLAARRGLVRAGVDLSATTQLTPVGRAALVVAGGALVAWNSRDQIAEFVSDRTLGLGIPPFPSDPTPLPGSTSFPDDGSVFDPSTTLPGEWASPDSSTESLPQGPLMPPVMGTPDDTGVDPGTVMLSTYRERFNRTPVSNGYWTGARGESEFISTDPRVAKILGGRGITNSDAYPDSSEVSVGTVTIPNMTEDRGHNFSEADAKLGQLRGVAPREIAQ